MRRRNIKPLITKVVFISLLFGHLSCSKSQPQPLELNSSSQKISLDAAYLCELVSEKYYYYPSRSISWKQACTQAQNEARAITNKQNKLSVFETLIDSLYDAHVSLGTNSSQSPRLIPSGADIWVEWKSANLLVVGVRPNGGADEAGILVGDIIVSINGLAPKAAANSRMRTQSITDVDIRMNWAINAAIAGYRGENRTLGVRRNDKTALISLNEPEPTVDLPLVSSRIINNHIGYIKFNNSLGKSDTVEAFENVVKNMQNPNAWILDLRNTPGGGNTSVAEPILGRFIEHDREYQQIVEPGQKPYNRIVHPSGPQALDGPLIVLVGRWTGSMGEGMAIGVDGMQRGLVIGSPMAGLAGGTNGFTLPATQIQVGFPTYDLRHINGTPRHKWTPPIAVVADNGSGSDFALTRAIVEISK